MDLGRREAEELRGGEKREAVGGREGSKTVFMMYCMKEESIFNFKKICLIFI